MIEDQSGVSECTLRRPIVPPLKGGVNPVRSCGWLSGRWTLVESPWGEAQSLSQVVVHSASSPTTCFSRDNCFLKVMSCGLLLIN
jgi:hypothetical protein